MSQSIRFYVKKWQYNENAKKENFRTDLTIITSTLSSNKTGKTEGLTFTWLLVITANEIEVLYYSSEEWVIINDINISDDDLLAVIRQSYNNSNKELSIRNAEIGLNASFLTFEEVPMDLSGIRQALNTGR